MNSEETQLRIAELRAKVARSESLTLDEAKEVVRLVRADRYNAVASAKKPTRGSKATAAKPDAQQMLAELEGL